MKQKLARVLLNPEALVDFLTCEVCKRKSYAEHIDERHTYNTIFKPELHDNVICAECLVIHWGHSSYVSKTMIGFGIVKEGENIERALKRYKRKFDRTKWMENLRSGEQVEKPSVVKRAQGIKAQYVQRLRTAEEQA